MLCQRRPIMLLIVVALLVGCDRGQSTPAQSIPAAAPATAPATTQPADSATLPATQAAATQPAISQLMIDGQMYKFPTARLKVSKANGRVIARLYTNDPKSALNDDYTGNSYDLKMQLDDLTDPHQVYTSVWQFKAPSREYVDGPYGIFLNGTKTQLQPSNATGRFLGDILMVRIDLDGEFLAFDSGDASAPPRTVFVKGSLLAPVEYKD